MIAMFWHLSEEIAANVCQMLSMENYGDSIVVLVTQQGVVLCYAFAMNVINYISFSIVQKDNKFLYIRLINIINNII